jgi:hypothetical protein
LWHCALVRRTLRAASNLTRCPGAHQSRDRTGSVASPILPDPPLPSPTPSTVRSHACRNAVRTAGTGTVFCLTPSSKNPKSLAARNAARRRRRNLDSEVFLPSSLVSSLQKRG